MPVPGSVCGSHPKILWIFSVGFLYEAQSSHSLDTYRQNCVFWPFWLVIMKVMVIDGDDIYIFIEC